MRSESDIWSTQLENCFPILLSYFILLSVSFWVFDLNCSIIGRFIWKWTRVKTVPLMVYRATCAEQTRQKISHAHTYMDGDEMLLHPLFGALATFETHLICTGMFILNELFFGCPKYSVSSQWHFSDILGTRKVMLTKTLLSLGIDKMKILKIYWYCTCLHRCLMQEGADTYLKSSFYQFVGCFCHSWCAQAIADNNQETR